MEDKKILHYIILDSDATFAIWQRDNNVELISVAPIVRESTLTDFNTTTAENVFVYSVFITYYYK